MLCVILVSTVLTMVGCYAPDERLSAESAVTTETQYDPTNVKVRHVSVESETEFELSTEEIETIVAIWNNGAWEPQITKTAYDYLFEFSGTGLRYVSEIGLFNDPDNHRHLYVTEEQRILINSFLD